MVMSLNSASCGPYTYSDKAYIEMIYDQNLQDIGAENKFQNRGIAIALIWKIRSSTLPPVVAIWDLFVFV